MRKWLIGGAVLILLATAAVSRARDEGVNMELKWREASQDSAGLAPKPEDEPRAVVQVYGAGVRPWRGYVGVHTWISVKPEDGETWTVYQLIGWRLRHSHTAVSIEQGAPDKLWYGAVPEIYADVRGPEAAAMIDRIGEAARAYPYGDRYAVWPGPNSNTFTAHVARAIPELRLDLPPTAVGKDFLVDAIVDKTPSGTGWQASVLGLFGVMFAAEEGFEINLLGLVFGLDPGDLAVKLPIVGRIGPKGGGQTGGAPEAVDL